MKAVRVSVSSDYELVKETLESLERQIKEKGLSGWAEIKTNGVIEAYLQGDKENLNSILSSLLGDFDKEGIRLTVTTSLPMKSLTDFKLLKSQASKNSLYCSLDPKFIYNLYITPYQKSVKEDSLHLQNIALRINREKDFNELVGELLRNVVPGQMREDIVKSISGKHKNVGASFSSLMFSQTKFIKHVKKITGTSLEWDVNNKIKGIKFAAANQVRVPEVYQKEVQFSELSIKNGCIIKPSSGAGSVGVFAVRNFENDILEVKSNTKLEGLDELKSHIENMLKSNKVKVNNWNVEELLIGEDGGIPRDIKIYTFYGEVGLVLEISRDKETKYCFYDGNMSPFNAGMYEDQMLEPSLISHEYIRLAAHLGKKIPAPMIRIDFLKTNNGPVFGEFTPRPGKFSDFNVETDRMLGEKFVEAQARLFSDLIKGKSFKDFFDLVR